MFGKARMLVCGVGNAMNGDEKVGRAAIEDLGSERLGEGVVLLDCGPRPGDYRRSIMERRPGTAVVVSALDTGKPPGTVDVMRSPDARKLLAGRSDVRLQFFLGFLEGFARDVRLIAVQPRTTAPGRPMSPECVNAVRKVREEVLRIAGTA
jgi:hydrogenase maturation protease